MTDALPTEIYDPIAMRELEMMADLMILANTNEQHLSQKAIDAALGIDDGR